MIYDDLQNSLYSKCIRQIRSYYALSTIWHDWIEKVYTKEENHNFPIVIATYSSLVYHLSSAKRQKLNVSEAIPAV